jgi:hypothetical protein
MDQGVIPTLKAHNLQLGMKCIVDGLDSNETATVKELWKQLLYQHKSKSQPLRRYDGWKGVILKETHSTSELVLKIRRFCTFRSASRTVFE